MFGARFVIGMVLVGLLATSAMAQTRVFTGADGSGAMDDPANWSPANYPYGNPIVIDDNDPFYDLTDAHGWALASDITLNRTAAT